MSRRTNIIKTTSESKALKSLRLMKGLSVRKTADLLGVSHTLVSHLEIGRANIQKAYIEKFLVALDLSWEDWTIATGASRKAKAHARSKITSDCLDKLEGLSEDKLMLINSILSRMQ